MDSQKQILRVKFLSQFVQTLHKQQVFVVSAEFQHLSAQIIQSSEIQLLNLHINDSLLKLPHVKKSVCFQRDEFIVGNILRKIGCAVKIIAGLCKFSDRNQQLLARFQTTQFLRQFVQQSTECQGIKINFIDFLKGIFPSINTHQDNIPLYMPFYDKLSSYTSKTIGNANWQTSRLNLGIIYKQQLLAPNVQEQTWYLLLTGSKKLLTLFQENSLQKIWAHMYYFYVNKTLEPYRINMPVQPTNDFQVTIQSIKGLIREALKQQKHKHISLLLSLLTYLLQDSCQQLQSVYNQFRKEYQNKLQTYKNGQLSKQQLSIYGLINTLFNQLLRNLIQGHQKQNSNNTPQLQVLTGLRRQSQEIILDLVSKRIPYHDFYLRITYPGNQKNKAKQNDAKVLQILNRQISKDGQQDYQFPSYPFQKQFFSQLSTLYLNKYPQKILQIAQFLPAELSTWKLLTSQELDRSAGYYRIRECLLNNKTRYLQVINKKQEATSVDYDHFIEMWNQYHQLFTQPINLVGLERQYRKVVRCKHALHQITNIIMQDGFRKRIRLPLDNTQNILRVMDYMIEGFDQIVYGDTKTQKVLNQYTSFILQPMFKQHILAPLSQQQKTQVWKKWSSVLIADQSLVNQLISHKQDNQEKPFLGQRHSIGEGDNGNSGNRVEVMQIE